MCLICLLRSLNALSDHVGFNIKVYINGVSNVYWSLTIAVFIGTVINHVFILVRKQKQSSISNSAGTSSNDDLYSPTCVVSGREPLKFDFDKTID